MRQGAMRDRRCESCGHSIGYHVTFGPCQLGVCSCEAWEHEDFEVLEV